MEIFDPQNCECILKFRSAEAVLQREGCSLVHCYHQKNQKETMLKKMGPCYCQTVQESKHITYLAFIQQSLQSHNKLVGMIFADKSMIWSSVMGKSAFYSLIWAWISTRCAMLILILTGIRKKEFYINNILGIVLLHLLFMQATYTDSGYQFQKDNDPKNTVIKFT